MSEQVIRVSVTTVDDDGNVKTRSVTDEDARRWQEMNEDVDKIAYRHGCTVDYSTLNWQTEPGMLVKGEAAGGDG